MKAARKFQPKPNSLPFWIVSVGGIGAAPKAPGTFGTLAAVPIWFVCYPLVRGLEAQWLVLILTILTALSTFAIHIYEKQNNAHDDQQIVLDEVVGFLAGAIWFEPSLYAAITIFVLFRFFDITKPGPVGWCDREIHHAIGTILDDVLAGLFSGGVYVIIMLVASSLI